MNNNSLKLKSTCDACQDGKVRCSREKPSCRRCQNLARKCVYSSSRRLGRPRRPISNVGVGGGISRPQPNAFLDENPFIPENSTMNPSSISHDASTGSFSNQLPATADASNNFGQSSELVPLDLSNTNEIHRYTGLLDRDRDLESESNLGLEDFNHSFFLTSATSDFDAGNTVVHSPHIERDRNDLTSAVSTTMGNFSGPESRFHNSSIRSSPFEGVHFPTPNSISGNRFVREGASNDDHSSQAYFGLDIHNIKSTRQPGLIKAASSKATDSMTGSATQYPHGGLKCNCYGSVLRVLYKVNEKRSALSSATIDQVMRLEKDVQEQMKKVLECNLCSHNRPRVLVLIGVVVESILDVLEGVFVEETSVAEPSDFREGGQTQHFSKLSKHTRSSSDFNTGDNTSLRLGVYEISGQEKPDFIRYLLQTRLDELSAIVQRLQSHMQQDRRTLYHKVGVMMISEIDHRLQAVISTLAS